MDGTVILVGVSYRYALYKPDPRRPHRAKGRWQLAGPFGWENCDAPERFIVSPTAALKSPDTKTLEALGTPVATTEKP